MIDASYFQNLILGNLRGIDEGRVQSRRAYLSGLYIGLVMALQYIEAGRPKLPNTFSRFFTNPKNHNLPLQAYLGKFAVACNGIIKLTVEDFQNTGLRFGIPGSFYAKGIWDAVRMSILESQTSAWVDAQLEWLSKSLV